MLPQEYCRDVAAPPGSNFHYSTLFETPEARGILCALFAFLAEVNGALRHVQEPAVGRLRLHWWIEEIDRLQGGAVVHPVSLELGRLVRNTPGLQAELRGFLASALNHLDAPPPARYSDWMDQCAAVHGRIWTVTAHLCAGAETPLATDAGRIGGYLAALEDVQQLPISLRAGRCPFPIRELEDRGLSAATLGNPAMDSAASRYLTETLERIRSDLMQVELRLASVPARSLLFCRIMARLAAALCVELKEEGALLLSRRTSLTPIRKLWIAWRTRLNA